MFEFIMEVIYIYISRKKIEDIDQQQEAQDRGNDYNMNIKKTHQTSKRKNSKENNQNDLESYENYYLKNPFNGEFYSDGEFSNEF